MPRQDTMWKFTVTSKFPFPMDMLRYDRCFPADSETAHLIAASHTEGFDKPVTYTLIGAQGWTGPTVDRWRSFMFSVTEMEELK